MRKEFTIVDTNMKEVELVVRSAGYEDFEEADRAYSAKLAGLVREKGRSRKLLLRSEVDKFLRESGIWSEADETEIKVLQKKIDTLLNNVRKGGEKASVGRKLCIEVMDNRKKIVQIMQKRQIFDDSTIEALAEAEKVDYLIYKCTVYAKDGRNYWDSFEDMKNDKASQAYVDGHRYTYEVIFGVNPEFEKRLPENKWLKKYNFIDDKLNYIDRKTGERVDRDGNPLKKLEEDNAKQIDNLQGDIKEESPFIDDETNEPILITV